MVYRFRLVSDEEESFLREVQVDSEATFLQLNDFILEGLGYSTKEITSFHICDDDWSMQQEITLMDMGFNSEQDSYLMESTRLEELVRDKGDKLFYVFDMFNERGFYMELLELLPGQRLSEPVFTIERGTIPQQIADLDLDPSPTATTAGRGLDLGEDFFDEAQLDLEDLDPEGFTDLDSLEGY